MQSLSEYEDEQKLPRHPPGSVLFEDVLKRNFDLFNDHELLLLGDIGCGGQGRIVRVACKPPIDGHSTFALKISPQGVSRKEVLKALDFKHEHFIKILGAGSKDGLHFIAMEEGEGNLYSTIKRVSPGLPSVALFEDLVEQIGSCLVEL